MKESLWSLDLFHCESVTLWTYWIFVVMDQYFRLIIGLGVPAGRVGGTALCRVFNHAIRDQTTLLQHLRCDHDRLFLFERWQTNLRIPEVAVIKTVSAIPNLNHDLF